MSGNPITTPRWYGYFKAVTGNYGVGSESGETKVNADIRWFGLPSSRVLVLTHRVTPIAPTSSDVKDTELHEWVVVVDSEDALPIRFDTVGGIDSDNQPYPAYGVFVMQEHRYKLSGTLSRDYVAREGKYAVNELLNYKDTENAPIGLMVSGVREVISHLDNADWDGPGSMIVYDRESSFGWLSRSEAQDFDASRDARWVPGKAGIYERFLIGTGSLDGWALYAIQNVLVLEFWHAGRLIMSKSLDAGELAPLINGVDSKFVIAFGYDLEKGLISIGVSGKEKLGNSAIAFKEYYVPEMKYMQHENRQVYIGGAPLDYTDGNSAHRSAWGYIKPVGGQFTEEGYLTQGRLAQLTERI